MKTIKGTEVSFLGMRNAISAALRLRGPLSTDSLCEHAGRQLKLTDEEFSAEEWKRDVYRHARALQRLGCLAAVKSFKKRSYEVTWRIA